MTIAEATAALTAARTKHAQTEDRIAALTAEDQHITDEIGRSIASDAGVAKKLHDQRRAVREELEDLVASVKYLNAALATAEEQHRSAALAEANAEMQTRADELADTADNFEASLADMLQRRAAFVAAGEAMRKLAEQYGDVQPLRFRVTGVADSAIHRRVLPLNDTVFLSNVGDEQKTIRELVAPQLTTAEIVR